MKARLYQHPDYPGGFILGYQSGVKHLIPTTKVGEAMTLASWFAGEAFEDDQQALEWLCEKATVIDLFPASELEIEVAPDELKTMFWQRDYKHLLKL